MSKQTGSSAEPPHDANLEALSCLVDGELEAGRCTGLLQKLCTDPQVRWQWTLMHVTGDALRSSEVASLHSEAFVARVANALDAEPAIVAPQASRGQRRFIRRVALPAVAVAAAASVLVFVAVPQLRGLDGSPAGSTSVSAAGGSTPAGSTPAPSAIVSAPATAVPPVASMSTEPAGTVVVQRLPELDAYVAAHREQSGTSMMLRSTPYLRTSATVPR